MRRILDVLHPSTARLRRWLETGETTGVAEHVDQCDRCADRLLELDASDAVVEPEVSSTLQSAFLETIVPPADLNERVLNGVAKRQRSERDLALLAGLFSIGVETAQLLLEGDAAAAREDDQRKEDES
ncbi:hypothetical protein [Ilumatobacter sp.]|uniref:hypothetical protein n=1 Tax=Ilumatobacter sp. TaxID=1967498 RepID=UPI003AF7E194